MRNCYAFVQIDDYEIQPGKKIKVNISVANVRLFAGNLPKQRSKEEIKEEFSKLTGQFCFLFLSLYNNVIIPHLDLAYLQ